MACWNASRRSAVSFCSFWTSVPARFCPASCSVGVDLRSDADLGSVEFEEQALFAELNASNAPSVGKTVNFAEALLRDVFGFVEITRVGSRMVDERLYAVTLEGLSGREAAQAMNVSEKALESLLVRGRVAIKQYVEARVNNTRRCA